MAIQLSPSFPYPRFGLFLYLVLVVLSPQPVSAVHNNTDKYTVQGLYDIIERIKPDVILVELDSSFLTPSMSIKPEFVGVSLENQVFAEYHSVHGIPIRPYDIRRHGTI